MKKKNQTFEQPVGVLALQLSNTTMQCGSLVLGDVEDVSTSGATMMGSGWSQNEYWQKTKLDRY